MDDLHFTEITVKVMVPDSPIGIQQVCGSLYISAHGSRLLGDIATAKFLETLFDSVVEKVSQEPGYMDFRKHITDHADKILKGKDQGLKNLIKQAADRTIALPPDDLSQGPSNGEGRP